MNIQKTAIYRKSRALAKQIPRFVSLLKSVQDDYQNNPCILVNSFPKSGTHLLLQIAEVLPRTRNFGSFLASTPSITFKERSHNQHKRMISYLVPGEIASAHLFYHSDFEELLVRKNCVHLFIYRDLRDVAISEAHYLTEMNRWHQMHPYFRNLSSDDARISQAITGINKPGFKFIYPDIGKRFERYKGWLSSRDVLCVRYENLMGENREKSIKAITNFYLNHIPESLKAAQPSKYDPNILLDLAIANIVPEKSHTFHKAKTEQWRTSFTAEHHVQFNQVAGNLLRELGYE